MGDVSKMWQADVIMVQGEVKVWQADVIMVQGLSLTEKVKCVYIAKTQGHYGD